MERDTRVSTSERLLLKRQTYILCIDWQKWIVTTKPVICHQYYRGQERVYVFMFCVWQNDAFAVAVGSDSYRTVKVHSVKWCEWHQLDTTLYRITDPLLK